MKCRTKFERKSDDSKDLTNKILTLLTEEEHQEELSRSLKVHSCRFENLSVSLSCYKNSTLKILHSYS